MKSPLQRSANVSSGYGASSCHGPRPGYVARFSRGPRIGRGIVGAIDELTPVGPPSRGARRGLSWFCFAIVAAAGAVLVFSGCAGATGSFTVGRGPVAIAITSDGKTVSGNIRATDGKNVIELQRNWRTAR